MQIAYFKTVSADKIVIALMTVLLPSLNQSALGDVLSLDVSVANHHFSRGVRLSDNSPTAALSLEWNSENGGFVGAGCYRAETQRIRNFERACSYYAGIFRQIDKAQAWSFEAKHNDYKSFGIVDWDYTELSFSWHHQNGFLASASISDNWLARDTKALAVDISYRLRLSEKLSGIFDAGIIEPIESGRLSSLTNAGLGIEYQSGLWSSSIQALSVQSNIGGELFSVHDQQNIMWTIGYQIY